MIRTDKNGGFSYGNNFGMRQAVVDGCENVLCVNSDVVFKENAIKCIDDMIKSLELAKNRLK